MYAALTDVVICPRCGPAWGLVLLAERVSDRRVLAGQFGCPNCRERYGVEGGFADLRPSSAPSPGAGGEPLERSEDRAAAVRLAALMGLGEGAALALVAGPAARLAPGVAGLLEGLEVIAVHEALGGWAEEPGVSRFAAAARLPFRGRSMGGVVLSGAVSTALLEEGARVLADPGRLVLEDAPADAETRLERASFEVVAREGGTVVARRRVGARMGL
ncbi:MAG TPA: hypothetical protein VF158_05895 [Longimicrobiales bacterium]